jgi:hypothetical protein
VTARSLTSWARLATLIDNLDSVEEWGGLISKNEATRLRLVVAQIIHADGGFDLRHSEIDFDDPAGGALAEHAFEVLGRELVKIAPYCQSIIDDIKSHYPHQPPTHPR